MVLASAVIMMMMMIIMVKTTKAIMMLISFCFENANRYGNDADVLPIRPDGHKLHLKSGGIISVSRLYIQTAGWYS